VAALHSRGGRIAYYLAFALGAFAMARAIRFARIMLGARDPGEHVVLEAVLGVMAVLLLVGCMFVLGLYVYEDLRWKGQLGRRRPLLERVLAKLERQ
jgi:hypothetical protein